MHLEVLELVDAEHAVLELPGVEDHALLDAQRAPQHAVLGLAVAGELDAADAELVSLVDDELDVRHQVLALDDLLLDAREHVAGVAVELLDLLESLVDHVLAQPAALGLFERVLEDLGRQDVVAFEQDGAQLPALALLHRDDDAELALLGPPLGVLPALDHGELGLSDHQVLVAGVVVDLAHVVEVLLDGRRVVDVALAHAGDQVRLLGLLHRRPQRAVAEDLVTVEGHLPDLHLVAFVDLDHHPQLVIGHPLELDGGVGEAVPLVGVERLDLGLEPRQLPFGELAALEQLDALLVDHLGDVGALELVEALVVDRDQGGSLLDRDLDPDAVVERRDVDLDVVDEVAVPELLQALVELAGVVDRAGLEARGSRGGPPR